MTRHKSGQQKDGLAKRGSKWSYIVRAQDPISGVTKQKWISGFKTKEEAKNARDLGRAEAHQGVFVSPTKITVEAFFRSWLGVHSLSLKSSTEVGYRENIERYIIPRIGKTPISNLRKPQIQQLYADLFREGGKDGKPLSARTVEYVASVLKKGLAYAVEVEGLLAKNPASRIPLPKGTPRRNEPWSPRELKIFLEGVSAHRLFAFFRLAAYSGARRGELCALKWSDFDSEGKKLTISKNRLRAGRETLEQASTKGGEGRRVISLDDETVDILRAHRRRQLEERLLAGTEWIETGYIFVQEIGQPINVGSPSQLLTKVRGRLGLPGQCLHDLRHLHATQLLQAGVPLHVVAQRLGHRDAMVTATIYAHVTTDQASQVANIFAKAVEVGA